MQFQDRSFATGNAVSAYTGCGFHKGPDLYRSRKVTDIYISYFSFGQAKYSSGIMHLCGGTKAADCPCKALKNLDSSTQQVVYSCVTILLTWNSVSSNPCKSSNQDFQKEMIQQSKDNYCLLKS